MIKPCLRYWFRVYIYFVSLVLCCAVANAREEVTLNFSDADIHALISTVSEHTGKNFIVDPRVKGKITVISGGPLDSDELYEVFLSILNVNGFAAVPSGSVVKIVPQVQAKTGGVPLSKTTDPGVGDSLVTRVVPVSNVTAAQLVPILRPLIPQYGHLAAAPSSNVLIISDSAGNVDRIVNIINRIDVADSNETEAIRLENASAAEVVQILTRLLQESGAKNTKNTTRLVADERTNSVLIYGDRAARLKTRALVAQLDAEQETQGNTRVVYLHYANAKELSEVLDGVVNNGKSGGASTAKKDAKPQVQTSIQVDENTNALIITADPEMQKTLQAVIRKLDVRRAQVLVEAIFAQISVERSKELGVQWIVDGTPGGNGPVGVIKLPGSGPGVDALAAAASAGTGISLASGLTAGLGKFNSSSTNFAVLLQALASDSTTNILSTPSVLTMDNEEAEIVVGQNVPFVTGQFTSTGASSGATNPFQTIERQDVGVSLKVKPQISEGSTIKLELEQEVSSVSNSTTGASDLVTEKSQIKTNVLVNDGEIIVMGGLMKEELIEGQSKVPLLGDLPLLGGLFRSNQVKKVKSNLMVFLKPMIMRDVKAESIVAGGKYNNFRSLQLKLQQEEIQLLPEESRPVLPRLDGLFSLPHPFTSE